MNTPTPTRWTRDYLFDILRELEVEYLFGVPGTNEIPIIDGCDTPENAGRVRYVECLHENIAMGAAMGYASATGKPGVVEVHVTPGIGHALGNLFNASRSRLPVVVLCGQQQHELLVQEPLLASNLVQVASQYTKWSHELRSWEEIPLVLQRAFKEAMAPPCGPVFLSLPWDFLIRAIGPDDRIRGVTRVAPRFAGDSAAVAAAATLLRGAQNPVIIAGDAVGATDAWDELRALAELLGAPVYLQGFSSFANFPNDDDHWQGELPGAQGPTQELLAPHDVAFLCGFGAQAQLAVFKYSDGPLLPATLRQVALADNAWDLGKNHFAETAILGDVKATLPRLNALLAADPPAGAAARNATLREAAATRRAAWDAYLQEAHAADQLWGVVVADELRQALLDRGLSDRFVYVHEAVSDASSFQMLLPLGQGSIGPRSYYCVAGGSLGWSMPGSLGIKLAAEAAGDTRRLVVNAVGDGSSLFYPQSYWTAAHRRVPILTLIMNNREYHTLQVGLGQVVAAYGDAPGYGWKPVTDSPEYLRLERPEVDFLGLARAFGVPNGKKVESRAGLRAALAEAIECVLERRESYVLDIRLDSDEPATPATASEGATATAAPSGPPTLHALHDARSGARSGLRGRQIVF